MPHTAPLISTIVAALGLAFLFGAIANRLRLPPIVGYLLAGVVVGPFTPGFVADQALATQLAEIGVILLMFGVGLHFSLKDLLSVRAIAVPGAVVQIGAATLLGVGLAVAVGWGVGAGLVFGLALSVASTVVLLRAMQERHLMETERGRIAVGWLIVEDLAMVLALVLLPALAGMFGGEGEGGLSHVFGFTLTLNLPGLLAVTVLKLAAFVALMLIVGRRVIPWVLHYIAHTGSRELFRLAVLAVALTAAFGAAKLFDVSLALGAFFAGMIMSESPLSHRATHETLPLRDAFAVLFFVSVGMLFNPQTLLDAPWLMLATLCIIIVGKSAAAYGIVRGFGYPTGIALTIAASLAQIGEFSFILAELGVNLDLLPTQARDLVLAGAILSIMLNPVIFAAVDRLSQRFDEEEIPSGSRKEGASTFEPTSNPMQIREHTILVGYGGVGATVGHTLKQSGRPFVVIELADTIVEELRAAGVAAVAGNAAQPDTLQSANLSEARDLIIAIPEPFEAGQVVEQARRAKQDIHIIVRAHSPAEVEYLTGLGANNVVMGEHEIARGLLYDLALHEERTKERAN